jgi:hypothetical protein
MPCCIATSASTARRAPLQLVLVRDQAEQWRDEALVTTDLSLTAEEMIVGYCRRWSVEVAFCDAKQLLGFHDPQCAASCQWSARRRCRGSWVRWWCCGMCWPRRL